MPPRIQVDAAQGTPFLWQARLEGLMAHAAELAQAAWDGRDAAATFRHLPPVGLLPRIAWDSEAFFPETYRLLAMQGADIVCMPTNWVPMNGQPAERMAMANTLVMANAHSNGLTVACADRTGTERGQPFIGQSLIVSYTGWPIGGPASQDKEEIVYAEANLADARRGRNWNQYNQVLRDRRTDVYDEMLGASATRGWY